MRDILAAVIISAALAIWTWPAIQAFAAVGMAVITFGAASAY